MKLLRKLIRKKDEICCKKYQNWISDLYDRIRTKEEQRKTQLVKTHLAQQRMKCVENSLINSSEMMAKQEDDYLEIVDKLNKKISELKDGTTIQPQLAQMFRIDLVENKGYTKAEARRIYHQKGEEFVTNMIEDMLDNWSDKFPIEEKKS